MFGAIDAYAFLDLKLSYQLPTGGRFSFWDQQCDEREVRSCHHPWPQRTFFAEYSLDLVGDLLSMR